MKKTSLMAGLLSLVIGTIGLPSSGICDETSEINSLYDGSWSVQFRINSNFTLATFEGSVLSLKKHYSDHSAVRVGVSYQFFDSHDVNAISTPDTAFVADADRITHNVFVDLQYLYYKKPDSKISLYMGAGPSVGYAKNRDTRTVQSEVSYREAKRWSFGVTGILGVEWFPTEGVGIHAEYGVQALFSSSKYVIEVESASQVSNRETDSWRVSGRNVLFGLSVYF